MPNNSAHFALTCPTIFDGENFLSDHCVVIEDGLVKEIVASKDCPTNLNVEHLTQGMLAPGFVDLQVNGGGDVLFHNAPTVESLQRILAAHRSLGTTSILPTLLSGNRALRSEAVDAVSAFIGIGVDNSVDNHSDYDTHGILGIHIEGPYFSPDKNGAHHSNAIEQTEAADINWLCEQRHFPVMLTLAPEQVPATQLQQLAKAGVLLAAGHTSASYEQMQAAADLGIQGVTHLFNAMSPFSSRKPGAVGACLNNDAMWASIIADGHHVHPAAIDIAYAAKPNGKLILVSDSMATIGGSQGSFELYGETISQQDGRLVNAAGKLAGSAIALVDAVRFAHREAKLPLADCLRMASLYPARIVALDNRLGRLAPGYKADIVHLSDGLETLHTWADGNLC